MEDIYNYAIGYPKLIHQIAEKNIKIKKRYMLLLKYYADKYCPSDVAVSYRLHTICNVLFEDDNIEDIYKEILEDNNSGKLVTTKFMSNRLFAYRYAFLVDCIFILALDNEKLGTDICNELILNVCKIYRKSLNDLKENLYSDKLNQKQKKIISKEMIEAWSDARKYIETENRNITFTATMSAGKSTVINSIIGRELSYAKKSACTSTIMSVHTAPIKNDFFNIICDNQVKIMQNDNEIREFTKGLQRPCDICGNFLSDLSKEKFTFIDTPGVNSSQNPEHKNITRNELVGGNTDILVYVIPVENYGSYDDFEHLTYIKNNVEYKNIIFVVNMMDLCDIEDDSVYDILTNIKEHLENIGFENPQICPISAKAGLTIKQALYGVEQSYNDKEECKRYIKIFQKEELALGKLYDEIYINDEINNISWLNLDKNTIWNAFVNTGLPGLEILLRRTK